MHILCSDFQPPGQFSIKIPLPSQTQQALKGVLHLPTHTPHPPSLPSSKSPSLLVLSPPSPYTQSLNDLNSFFKISYPSFFISPFFSLQPRTVNLLSAWPLQKPPAGFLEVFSSPVHHAVNITPHTCSAPSLDGRLPSSNQVRAQPCSPRLPASGPVASQPPTPSTPQFLSLAKDCWLHTRLTFLPSLPHLWPQCPQEAVHFSLLPPLS